MKCIVDKDGSIFVLIIFVLLFILSVGSTFAQSTKVDTITHRYDSLSKAKLNKIDSSNHHLNTKIDAAQSSINDLLNLNLNQLITKDKVEKKNQRRDSVQFYKNIESQKKEAKNKIDSLEEIQEPFDRYTLQLDSLKKLKYVARKNQFNQDHEQVAKSNKKKHKRDSIQFYKKLTSHKSVTQAKIDSLNKINQSTAKYQQQLDSLSKVKFVPHDNKIIAHQIDSLESINLSSGIHLGKLDSLNQINPDQYTKQVESKATSLQNKINQPVDKIGGAVNEKRNLMKEEGTNLPANASLPDVQLPSLSIPNTSLPDTQLKANPLDNIDNSLQGQMGKTGVVNEKISEAKGIPQQQVGKIKSINELQSAQSKLGEANAITDKAQGYSKDVQNIAKGDLKEVKELPKAAEEQAGKLGMDELQKETGQFDQYTEMKDKLKDPESRKAEALKKASTVAIDHFAGQQEILQGAMDKMGKLKSKYSSLNSLADIPKRKPNEMKGKPFIERLVPGIAFQTQKSGNILLDYNPLIGYRITGRFTAGAGWNERITIGKHVNISLADRIYGPRVFADFKVGKGFSIRTDIEKMNTYVPSLNSNGYSTSEEYRAWVWSAFVGVKKEYKFIKKVKGTFQIMYNLYDDHNNSPYADRLNMRFGFDFPLTKRPPKMKAEEPAHELSN